MHSVRFCVARQRLFRPRAFRGSHSALHSTAAVSACLERRRLPWEHVQLYDESQNSFQSPTAWTCQKRRFSSTVASDVTARRTQTPSSISTVDQWNELCQRLLDPSCDWEDIHNWQSLPDLCVWLTKDETLAKDPTRIQQVFELLNHLSTEIIIPRNRQSASQEQSAKESNKRQSFAQMSGRQVSYLFVAWRDWFLQQQNGVISVASKKNPNNKPAGRGQSSASSVISKTTTGDTSQQLSIADVDYVIESLQRFIASGLVQPVGAPFNILLYVLAQTRQAEKADGLMEWMEEQQARRRLIIPSNCYTELMSAHRLVRNAEACDAILRKLIQRSESVSSNHFHFQEKSATSDQRNMYGRVDPHHFSVALSAWVESNHPNLADKAEDIFQLLKNAHLRPSLKMYSSLMKAHAKQQSARRNQQRGKKSTKYSSDAADRCLEILNEMKQEGINPGIHCYATCIDACTKSGTPQAMEQAEDLLEEMQQDYGLTPNQVISTSIISGYARSGTKGAASHADAVFTKMIDQGIVPELSAYNSLIDAHVKEGNMERAEALVGELSANGLRPDIYTFNTWMNGYAKTLQPERMEQIYQHLMQMQKKGGDKDAVEPTSFTHTIRLQAWAKAGSPIMATKALQDTIRMGHKPEIDHFTAVLGSWLRSRLPEAAEKAEAGLRQMIHLTKTGRFDVSPDVVAYTTVLSCHLACNSPGLETKAMNMFREIKQLEAENPANERFRANSMFFARLIEAQVKSSNGGASEANLWEIIRELQDKPSSFWKDSGRKYEQELWSLVARKLRKSSRFRDSRALLQAFEELEAKGLGGKGTIN